MDAITECSPPSPDRGTDSTLYLPIMNDGRVDTVIYDLDSKLDALNKATFDFEPESIRSMHEGIDPNGCVDVAPAPVLDLSMLATFVTEVSDAVTSADTAFAGAAAEQMIQRAYDMCYGASGTSLMEMAQAVTGLAPLLETVATTTAAHADASYIALRGAITKSRATLAGVAEAVANSDPGLIESVASSVSGGLLPAGLASVIPGVGPAAVGATFAASGLSGLFNFFSGTDVTFPEEARNAMIDAMNSASQAVSESEQAVKDALAALNTAAEEIPTPIPGSVDVSTSDTSTTLAEDAPLSPAPAPLSETPISGGGSSGSAPLTDTSEPVEEPSLEDQLADLMGSDPMSGMPAGTGMGMPSTGTSPMSDLGSGMSSPLSNPMATEELSKPLDDLMEEEEEKPEEPLDDLSEDEEGGTEEPLEDPGEIGEGGELPEAEDPTEGEDDDTEDDTEGEPLPEEGEAPVEPEVDPNSEEARTADVGNGRKVLFPNVNLAALAEGLAAPGAENKTLRLIASELGFEIPPDGQDIGKQVPTSLLREGDAIVGAAGEGIFIGTDEVLMEGGKIIPLSEAAVFDGQNQGIFRLEEGGGMGGDTTSPAPDADALTGVAQPVGDGSTSPVGGTDPAVDATPTVSTPGDATAQSGTPGVPDDNGDAGLSSTDDTAAGAAFGETDNGAAGLNPEDVFPS